MATTEPPTHEMISLAVPNLDPDAPAMTDAQIKFGLYNHASVIQQLAILLTEQESSIVTLTYVLAAYMKQYPLDLENLDKTQMPETSKVEVPPMPGMYL